MYRKKITGLTRKMQKLRKWFHSTGRVEALEIKSVAHTMNLDCGLTLSSIWDTLNFLYLVLSYFIYQGIH